MNTSIQPHITPLEIIYEDETIIAVNKPNNYLVHHSDYARNLDDEKTLLDLLNAQGFKNCYPIHRLDRKTSGIILLAKQKEFVNQFQELFTSNQIQKTYMAIVRGFTPNSGIINSPIKIHETNNIKSAETHFKTINTIELDIPVHPYQKSRYSLVEILPKTGRMHQIRKHFNKISHPIIGDYKYGDRFHNRMFEQELNCNYMFLHAQKLSFIHPFLTTKVIFKADFPQDWKMLFKKFEWIPI